MHGRFVWEGRTWTVLICEPAQQYGHSEAALSLFEMIRKASVRPNELTFTGVLSSCVHAGLVEEGWKYFKLIKKLAWSL